MLDDRMRRQFRGDWFAGSNWLKINGGVRQAIATIRLPLGSWHLHRLRHVVNAAAV